MRSLARLLLYVAGVVLIGLAAGFLVLEGALVFGWNIWSFPLVVALGPYPRTIVNIEGAIYVLPIVAILILRAGLTAIGKGNDLP